MNRQFDLVITNEMVDIDNRFTISKRDGEFKQLIWNGEQATGIFEREDSRFNVTLTKVLDSVNYIVAAPNFYVCLETASPQNCAYKISERDVPSVDAESIQIAMRFMKKMIDEYSAQEVTDVRSQLDKANNALRNAFLLIEEGNKDENQMDYVSHPALSNTFDEVYHNAKRIEKIMYQK